MEYDQIKLQHDTLEKLRKATIHGNAAQKIAQRDFEKAQAELEKWTKRYELALQENNKELANKAKFQKERYQAIADSLIKLVIEQQPQLDKIKAKFDYLKEQLSEEQNMVSHPKFNTNTLSDSKNIENRLLESITNGGKKLQSYDNMQDNELISFESIEDELTKLKDEFVSRELYNSVNYEDLSKTINEAIDETKEILQSAIFIQKSIQEEYKQTQKEAKESHDKVQIALQNNDDNQALNAIFSKIVHNKCLDTIENQLKQQKATLTLIKNNLSVLENVKLIFKNENSLQQTLDADLEALRKELDEM